MMDNLFIIKQVRFPENNIFIHVRFERSLIFRRQKLAKLAFKKFNQGQLEDQATLRVDQVVLLQG